MGPLLFIIYFNDFPSCLKHTKSIVYADDTVIYVSGKDTFIIETCLSADMKSISEWCEKNELILNLNKGKTEAMLFGTARNLSKQPKHLNITYGYNSLNITTTYKYLGVELSQTLNLSNHFDTTYKRACNRLRLLNKIRSLLTPTAAKSIYQSTIIPLITYCGTIHLNLTTTQEEKLISLHNRAINIIKDNSTYNPKLISPKSLIIIAACLLTRKCLDGDVCTSFKEYFTLSSHTKSTRNNNNIIRLPKIRLEVARGSFYFMGAKLYNELPLDLRKTDTFNIFKRQLKQYIN